MALQVLQRRTHLPAWSGTTRCSVRLPQALHWFPVPPPPAGLSPAYQPTAPHSETYSAPVVAFVPLLCATIRTNRSFYHLKQPPTWLTV